MAYQFDAVDICVFDFHLMTDPLLGGISTKQTANFLIKPAAYNSRYVSATPLQTARLKFKPLDWRARNYHHFWRFYQTIRVAGSSYDFWKLQMPFLSGLDVPIKLVSGSITFSGTVRPTVFLNGLGWSTNLDIRLLGQMTSDDVRDFVGRLSTKPAAFFEINGKRMTLPEVFEYVRDIVLNDIYEPKSIDSLKIKRQIVMALAKFIGPTAYYPANQQGKRILRADRGSIHSMLLGVPVSFDDVLDLENRSLVTQFGNGPDFALSHFDKGTLLFMQTSASAHGYQDRALRSKMLCHLFNIRNYLLMTLDVCSFCGDTKKNPAINASTQILRNDLVKTVQAIPQKYSNDFCQSFHNNYGPIRKL